MRIACTVNEFGKIVRGCEYVSKKVGCLNCIFHEICACTDGEGVECFVHHNSIVGDEEDV